MDYGWIMEYLAILKNPCSIYNLMVDYRNIKVPNDMIEDINSLIKKHTELGYRTHSEFIIDAIRRRIEDVRTIRLTTGKYVLQDDGTYKKVR